MLEPTQMPGALSASGVNLYDVEDDVTIAFAAAMSTGSPHEIALFQHELLPVDLAAHIALFENGQAQTGALLAG